jgi:hypothetical protein
MQIVVMNLAFRITFDKHFDSAKDPWLREYIDNARLLQSELVVGGSGE